MQFLVCTFAHSDHPRHKRRGVDFSSAGETSEMIGTIRFDLSEESQQVRLSL